WTNIFHGLLDWSCSPVCSTHTVVDLNVATTDTSCGSSPQCSSVLVRRSYWSEATIPRSLVPGCDALSRAKAIISPSAVICAGEKSSSGAEEYSWTTSYWCPDRAVRASLAS